MLLPCFCLIHFFPKLLQLVAFTTSCGSRFTKLIVKKCYPWPVLIILPIKLMGCLKVLVLWEKEKRVSPFSLFMIFINVYYPPLIDFSLKYKDKTFSLYTVLVPITSSFSLSFSTPFPGVTVSWERLKSPHSNYQSENKILGPVAGLLSHTCRDPRFHLGPFLTPLLRPPMLQGFGPPQIPSLWMDQQSEAISYVLSRGKQQGCEILTLSSEIKQPTFCKGQKVSYCP